MQGYGNNQSCKKDSLNEWMNQQHRNNPTIVLTQEMWEKTDGNTRIGKNGALFISNSNKIDESQVRGGVGIILSRKAEKAWKRAGQPDPIKPNSVAKTARNIALELHFLDSRKRTQKIFVISTYLPCSDKKYSEEDLEETLEQLQDLINQCP